MTEVTFQMPDEDNGEKHPVRKGVIVEQDDSDWVQVEVKVDWKTKKIYNVRRDWVKKTNVPAGT